MFNKHSLIESINNDNDFNDFKPEGINGGTLALISEDGKYRVMNTFDKMHLSRLKGLGLTLNNEISRLNLINTEFQGLSFLFSFYFLFSLSYFNSLFERSFK